MIEYLVEGRNFGFSLGRVVSASVLRRSVVSDSDRACERWLDSYRIAGIEHLELHRLYRVMVWLGEDGPN